jgi:hypothetical protein
MFAKSPSRKRFPKKSTKVPVSVFLGFFLFYRVFEFKNTHKKRFAKTGVSKSIYKKIAREFKTVSLIFCKSFWAFLGEGQLVRGVQKHHKKVSTNNKQKPGPWPFFGGWVWDLANARGGPSIFWGGPSCRLGPLAPGALRVC